MSEKDAMIEQVKIHLEVQIAEADEMIKRANEIHSRAKSLAGLIYSALNDAGHHGLADYINGEIKNAK